MPYTNPFKDNPGASIIDSPKVLAEISFRPQLVRIHYPYRTVTSPARLRVEMLLGLTPDYGRKQKFTPEFVRKEAMKIFPHGGTVIIQLGWWGAKPEKSVRLIIMSKDPEGKPFDEPSFVERYEFPILSWEAWQSTCT